MYVKLLCLINNQSDCDICNYLSVKLNVSISLPMCVLDMFFLQPSPPKNTQTVSAVSSQTVLELAIFCVWNMTF